MQTILAVQRCMSAADISLSVSMAITAVSCQMYMLNLCHNQCFYCVLCRAYLCAQAVLLSLLKKRESFCFSAIMVGAS